MTLTAHDVIIVFYFQVWRTFLNRGLFYFSYFHLPGSSICCPIHPLCIHPLLCTSWSRRSWRRHPPRTLSIPGWGGNHILASFFISRMRKELDEAPRQRPGVQFTGVRRSERATRADGILHF